jgi:HD-like signal output (HDOD) protein
VTQSTITDAELAEVVSSLPTSARLLSELAPKLQQIEVAVEDVTELLRRDPGLTARLIAIANSAMYARVEPATALEEAVACIGYSDVYRLIGALAARQLSDHPVRAYGVDGTRFRQNALFVALVIEELATLGDIDPRQAYTVGLLRSVGKVALDRLAETAGREVAPLRDEQPLLDWERATWGTTSAEVGARILALWRFPAVAVEAVRDHFTPAPTASALSHLLNISAGAADLRGFGLRGEESYWQFTPENFARTAIDEGKLVWAGERAFRTLERMTTALG